MFRANERRHSATMAHSRFIRKYCEQKHHPTMIRKLCGMWAESILCEAITASEAL